MKNVLNDVLEEIQPDKKSLRELKKQVNEFVDALGLEVNKRKKIGEVFVGGSFAKGTLIKKDKYDVDIFVRFDWRYTEISDVLEKPLARVVKRMKLRMERIHGSRDYFRVHFPGFYFEVIPVTKIKHPREERNVTDLTYFHVPYVKRRIGKLKEDVMLAKTFCHAQKVYGAETYVRGFSGYALELLVIYYGGFSKMLRQLTKIKKGARVVIDPAKHYKKNEALFELSEAKLQSPIILIDPTYKERNALAALSRETFERFQDASRKFLKKPGKSYFIEKKIDAEKIKRLAKKPREFLHVNLKTDRQEGDIAGTKMKKFSEFLTQEMKKYFKIVKDEFDYQDKKEADFYLVVESKKEIIQVGPPNYTKKLRKHIQAFKKAHKKTYVKEGILHARIKIDFTGKQFLEKIAKDKKQLNEMGITGLKIA